MDDYLAGIATGTGLTRLTIQGRPRRGTKESYVLCEEPTEPVLLHYRGRKVPHYRRDCPHCGEAGESDTTPYWYFGAIAVATRQPVIVELTYACFRAAQAAATHLPASRGPQLLDAIILDSLGARPTFRGLLVTIGHGQQYWLRCDQRVTLDQPWPHDTRRELARIWEVPIRPRVYREA